MSCNGCRVLRKGCSESCILRPCLQWIDTPEAQGHATVFVAKFFGRAGLMSFISAVAENQRPALFQSLLYEAVGRTVNPVNGAVGLLYSGNWIVCETAVETVLRGGTLKPLSETPSSFPAKHKNSPDVISYNRSVVGKMDDWSGDLGLCLNSYSPPVPSRPDQKRRAVSPPSLISDSSVTGHDSDESVYDRSRPKMLNLFV